MYNSNTSYVLIHQLQVCGKVGHQAIQIHPMFLFINYKYVVKLDTKQFKYILCSYSSDGREYCHIPKEIQIHPMFLFIRVLQTAPQHQV